MSLHVQPDDSSFASIFGSAENSISVVKNQDGEVYLPGEGIEQISTWRGSKGYKVHAEAATTLEVTGAEASPGAMEIELRKGGNIIPYPSTRVQAVENALPTIEESLTTLVDEDGRRYDPSSASSSPLDSLRPGQGYKVYVDRADTLRYPEVAKTLDEALALTGMEVGSYVYVRGYHESGDGGGGLFQVNDSACRTDGGTCFIFDEDLSSEQNLTFDAQFGGIDLPDTDIAWRTFKVRYGTGQDQFWPVESFHGHWNINEPSDVNGSDPLNLLDTKAGYIGNLPFGNFQNILTGDESHPENPIYKYATSNRRLERMNVTNSVNVEWWGAKPVSDGYNGFEDVYTREINWAITTAKRLKREKGLDTFYVDFPDVYYSLLKSFLPEDIFLRGTGAEKTWPNGVVTRGGIRVPPGEALWHQDTTRDPHLGVKWLNRPKKTGLTNGNYPDRIGLRNFEFDGNQRNNQQVWDDPTRYGGWSNLNNGLQNALWWSFFVPTGAANTTADYNDNPHGYIEGLDGDFNDVAIRDLGGNGITHQGRWLQNIDGVYMDDSARNHLYYAGGGTVKDMTVEGYSWAVPIKVGSWGDAFEGDVAPSDNSLKAHAREGQSAQWETTLQNVTFQDPESNPLSGFQWGTIFNPERANVTIDGFTIDLRGGNKSKASGFYANGARGLIAKNGEVWAAGMTFVKSGGKKIRTFQPYERNRFTNITYTHVGSDNFNLLERFTDNTSNNYFKNITVNPNGYTSVQDGEAIHGSIAKNSAVASNLPGAKRTQFENVDWGRPYQLLARVNVPSGEVMAQDLFVTDSKVDNQGDWSLKVRNDDVDIQGRADRLYMSNTTFNVPTSGLNYDTFHYGFSDAETKVGSGYIGGEPRDFFVKPSVTIRVRNCDTPNGRVSDSENNTFTSGSPSEGQDYVLISTSLLSRPREVDLTLASGSPNVSSITGWEVANSDGSLRPDSDIYEHDPHIKVNLDGTIGSGESVTIDWTARVTPLSEYTTTGLFISRPVKDYTSSGGNDPLQSGGGPWQVDLRGVAASQETWTPATYSATSSDTGVVTANVLEKKHRDLTYDWELQLTEQSAGTATITVDAEIPGVGTATTTFEVTVE
ncbi:hypothetical protein GGQ18_002973 [Salinibacter ruber]|uniref:hypothetical protein n=1 Tax=Salinibacter ruber TaxID=146919 RepID=UPI0016190F38|nr:hypothetical protein [Salinibacter ruber]MBB4070364.1 hypothetical protein [Salinibacter ruber]